MPATDRSPFRAAHRCAVTIAVLTLLADTAWAQAAEPQGQVYTLGQVLVTGRSEAPGIAIEQAQLQRDDLLTTGQALEAVPGVVLSKVGARNEQMVQVRGFDLRAVPVFIDGIPVYVPYDGYVDLGRFTTFDLSQVVVEKGHASVLYGANTLGGAINLVGRRPGRPLELDGGVGLSTDRSFGTAEATWAYANLGMRRELGYVQLGLSSYAQDSYTLPHAFKPVAAEDGGPRNNSRARDQKINLKLAYTPNAQDEYAINVIDQHGVKGNPPYAGSVAGVSARYWDWPYWDKRSAYLLSKTHFGDKVLNLRVFHDTFANSLYAYDDATYTTQARPSSFKSWYDDYSKGASGQLDWPLSSANTLGLAAHFKQDVHREHNQGEPVRVFRETTTSLGLEDEHRFSKTLSAVLGASHDRRATQQAQDYNSSTRVVSEFAHGAGSTDNAQAQLRWRSTEALTLRVSAARKSRFPTIKDRYSYRLGTALPNPDLKPERATHFELGATTRLSPQWTLDAALFRANIADLIQSMTISTLCGSSLCNQSQNVGRARSQGLELALDGQLGAWTLDGHYQYLDRDNLSNPAVLLTDTPRQQVRLHVGWQASDALSLHGTTKAASRRYSNSTGTQVASGFSMLDLKAVWQMSPAAAVEAGVHNVGDRLYAYTEGFPEPGRQGFVQLRFTLQ